MSQHTIIPDFRDWVSTREGLCLSQAMMLELDAIAHSDTSRAQDILLWRARGTVYHDVLAELDKRGIS